MAFVPPVGGETRVSASPAGHNLHRSADADAQSGRRRAIDDRHLEPAATAYKRDEGSRFGLAVGSDQFDCRSAENSLSRARHNRPRLYIGNQVAEAIDDDYLAVDAVGSFRRPR